MAKNKEVLKNQFLVASVIDPVFRITILIIGFSAFILYSHINIDKNIFDSWIQAYLEGDFIRYRSGIIQGKLIQRQQKFIEVLQAKASKLKEYQLQNSKK